MRLLIAADIFSPDAGGPATYAVTLANELARQDERVTIVSLNPQSDARGLRPGVALHRVHTRRKPWRYIEYLFLLWWYAWGKDIIYAMGPVNAGWPALQAARWLRLRPKKLVVKVVGDYAWEQGVLREGLTATIDEFQTQEATGLSGRLRRAERQVVQMADAVIVPCQYLRQMVIGWGATSEKVQVIYNAVEVRDVLAAPKPAGEKWIVSVGRLVPWKGMEALIEIMPEIIKVFPTTKLKIIGSGPESSNLKLKTVDLRLNDCVELTGNLSREATLGYIKAVDVFVLNSGYEGLSHVILEAMMLRRIICVSNVGGNSELIADGLNGFLFKYNDCKGILETVVSALKTDKQLAAKFVEGVKEQFSLKVMINTTRLALERLITNNQ